MKLRITATVLVFLACAAFIVWSTDLAFETLDRLDWIAVTVIERVEAGDLDSAFETLGEMSVVWEEKRSFMETVMPHEDLQRVIELITEAQANLEARDADDFSRSIALLRETLDHLRNHERLSWANVL